VLAVALMQTPHRFRTKRQLWAYSGLALETRTSADYRYVEGQLRRSRKVVSIRGLNKDHNHDLKGLFKAAATMASVLNFERHGDGRKRISLSALVSRVRPLMQSKPKDMIRVSR
jgi:hypothetical protein